MSGVIGLVTVLRVYSARYEDRSDRNLEAEDWSGQHLIRFTPVHRCLLRVPEVCVRFFKLACTRKASACPTIRAVLECQPLRIGAFVSIFAVWYWMESFGRTYREWRCVALRPDDLRGDMWAFRLLISQVSSCGHCQIPSYRVARRRCGRPALSELGVKVSLHPAQALRTPR